MNFTNERKSIEDCVRYVQQELDHTGTSRENRVQAILTLEDVLSMLVSKGSPGTEISVKVVKFLGNVSLKLSSAGEPFDKSDMRSKFDFGETLEPLEASVIDGLIEKTIGGNLNISHSRGINRCTIVIEKSGMSTLIVMLGALAAGLLTGLLLKTMVSPEFAQAAAENLFSPLNTMFLNALKMIVGPLTFLSIASSIVGFGDVRILGKTAGKIFAWFMIISLMGILVGYCAYEIMPIGDASLQAAVSDSAKDAIRAAGNMDNSIINLITGIIPADIVSPFLNMDMLQLIFIAVLFGIGIITCGSSKGVAFGELVSGACDVVIRITNCIVAFMPVSVFCSMAALMTTVDMSSFTEVIMWVPSCYLGHAMLMLAFMLLVLIFLRINPFRFVGNVSPALITAFVTGSSHAPLTTSMKLCEERLGVPPKICAFAIPLGAAANRTGVCLTLVVTVLFMAESFSITMDPGMVLSLVITILMLSVASPAIPGGCLISMAVVFPMAGIPAEAVSIVMGLYCLVGMAQTVTNVAGNIVVTAIAGKIR